MEMDEIGEYVEINGFALIVSFVMGHNGKVIKSEALTGFTNDEQAKEFCLMWVDQVASLFNTWGIRLEKIAKFPETGKLRATELYSNSKGLKE